MSKLYSSLVTPLGYRPQSVDTSVDNDQLRFHLYQQRTTVDRLLLFMAD
jgi:hypothetical protein